MTYFYRFIVDGKGIYEVVDRDCPRDDARRKAKPDGSWLPKEGAKFPGAVSLWSKEGLNKYVKSGLLAWHASVVKGDVRLQIAERPVLVLYEDALQVICSPKVIRIVKELSLQEFLKSNLMPC